MTTITLIQNARGKAADIVAMTARPVNVLLTGLTGGPAQFQCTNALAAIQGAKSVDITYSANVAGDPHDTIQVSSVIS